jgi:hypothetical protein
VTSCLRPEEFVDLLDGRPLAPARRAHVEACPVCRASLADLAAALHDARTGDVPEPPPFFWTGVNARVRAAVDAEPRPSPVRSGVAAWLRWDTVVSIAGIAVVLVMLGSAVDEVPRDTPISVEAPATAAAVSGPALGDLASGEDQALALVLELAGGLPDAGLDMVFATSLPDLGTAAASALSAEEQDALAAILRAAVNRPPS